MLYTRFTFKCASKVQMLGSWGSCNSELSQPPAGKYDATVRSNRIRITESSATVLIVRRGKASMQLLKPSVTEQTPTQLF